MIQFSDLSKELNQLQASFDELESLNNLDSSSQTEAEEYIEYTREQLQILVHQIQEIKTLLETSESENKLLKSKLCEALKVRDQLILIGSSNEECSTERQNNETNELIKITEDLQQEVTLLRKELDVREKFCCDIENSHHRAEKVIITENNRLKDENESLNIEIKNVIQSYNNVKKHFLENVETLKLMKAKLLEQKLCIQENEQLRNENSKLAEEFQEIQRQYEQIKKGSKSYLNELASMKEKLMKSNACFEENGRLNTDNVKLAQDLQQVQEKYEKTKEESMLYLSELNLIKEKLLENDVFFEEYKQLKIDNVKLVQELQLLQDKYENIKEESKLNLNELNSLKEKLMDSSIYFEENEALKKEIIALDNNLENSKTSVINLEEDLKGAEKLLQDALETIISKDTECNELNDRLAEQQEMMNELKEQTNKHIRLLQQECNDYIEREKDVIDKFFTFSDICEDQMEYLSDDQNCSIFANVHYEIDIEYLKGVISNQKVCIASLEEFIENSKKPEVILQDVGVSAVEEPVITKDIGVLAVNTTQNEIDKMQITTSVLYKVLDRLDTYKERNQNPCDSKDLVEPGSEEDAFVLKILGMIDQKISSLLAEVKDFYETSICDLHKKYNSEAERQLSFSETSLAKLKFCYEKNLKIIKREHDEKVIRLLASHEEELRSVSMYQQKIHSIKEKISKGKKSKRN